MPGWIGDYDTSSRIDDDFATVDTTGLPTAITSGSLAVRRQGVSALAPAGVAALSSSGGLHHVIIFTGSATSFFIGGGAQYVTFVANGTVGTTSIIGYPVHTFTLGLTATRTHSANVTQWLTSAPNVLISGRVDANAQAMATAVISATTFAAGAIDAAAVAADAIGASELAQSAAQEVADEVLNRDIAGSASGNTRNVRNALRMLRNRWEITGLTTTTGTLTVYQENDTTAAWEATLTVTSGNPVIQIDPA